MQTTGPLPDDLDAARRDGTSSETLPKPEHARCAIHAHVRERATVDRRESKPAGERAAPQVDDDGVRDRRPAYELSERFRQLFDVSLLKVVAIEKRKVIGVQVLVWLREVRLPASKCPHHAILGNPKDGPGIRSPFHHFDDLGPTKVV